MTRKNTEKIIFLAFISQLLFLNISNAESKKKLFVNNITAKGEISKETAQKARDYITLSIFENYGRYYQIITDDDIKIMYKQAELMMSAGSDSESAVVQVANAIDADEIIYGYLSKDGGKLRFSIQNLNRDRSNNIVSKKSFVNVSFFESKMEWYCNEIAKKLINPEYKIDNSKAVSKITAKFEVPDIKIKKFKGVNIKKIKFESHDEISVRIVNDLMTIVKKGDEYFKEKDYDDALEKYRKTIKAIGRKLRKATQRKIEPFTESVLERIAAVHTRNTKKQIEKIDNWIKSQNPLTVDALKNGKKNYEKIVKPLLKLPSHEKIKMDAILKSIEDRLTSIYLSWVSLYEKKGDYLYGDYQFKKAIKHYKAGKKIIERSGVRNKKMRNIKNRIDRKQKITRETGASWLENKVLSYCNAAEYLNLRNKKSKAKKYLSSAKKLIKSNKEFANQRMVSSYKETARILKR